MARHDPSARLRELVRSATAVFIEQGYKSAQMEDVAKAMRVAKGTLYVYVKSKEALFDLVARCADRHEEFEKVPRLPIRTPGHRATIAYVRQRLAEQQILPTLEVALTRRGPAPRGEFQKIVAELYAAMEGNRYGLKLIDRTAKDLPELATLWFAGARGGLVAALSEYLRQSISRGNMKEFSDITVAARFIIETAVFWAVHRHWDPHPQKVDDNAVRETVVRLIVNAIVKE